MAKQNNDKILFFWQTNCFEKKKKKKQKKTVVSLATFVALQGVVWNP